MKDSDLIYGIMISLEKQLQTKEYSISHLKYLTAPFDITDNSIRTTLSRMKQKNVIESKKVGKTTYYSISEKGKKIGKNVALSFKSPNWDNWENEWWSYVFSIPQTEKPLRYRVRKKLQSYRFVSLYPGCWIRPIHIDEEISCKISSLLPEDKGNLLKINFIISLTKEHIQNLWKVEDYNRESKDGILELKTALENLANMEPKEAFFHKMTIGNRIIQLLFRDPLLPTQFLPEHWAGHQLREIFWEWEKKVSIKAGIYLNKYQQ